MVEQLKRCFVIAPIGEEGSDTRAHSDDVLELIINPVITSLGFSPGDRADKLGKPGVITTQILERIAKDELVIADLTDHNPNVFYELAIRHGLRKPFIQMIRADQKIPFDVGQQRTIKFNAKTMRGGEAAKAELKTQVEECLKPGFEMETPLGRAFDFQALQAGGAVERTLKVIVDKLDGLARRHAHDKQVRLSERLNAAALATPTPRSNVNEDVANHLLRTWFPDYSPEKAKEFLASLNSILHVTEERFQTWLEMQRRDQALKMAKQLEEPVDPVVEAGKALDEPEPD